MKYDKIEIVIANDHAIVRQGLRKLLEEDNIKITGEAVNGRESVRKVQKLKPDVIITADISENF